ncbi:MAG: S49 family peptidase [Alphaproteobacteria bacterium]|nr:S49 family peptidase [Alphaproteobacteria bacterium]
MRTFWKIVVGFLAVVGGIVVIFAAAGILVSLTLSGRPAPLPDTIVLRLNLDDAVRDGPPPQKLLAVRPGVNLRAIVEGLEAASTDDRVAGLAVYMGGPQLSVATAQELRTAIDDFRAAGKFALLFSEDLGGLGGGTVQYYLATGFDEIWLQPSGGVGLIGMAIEVPFARGLLDKLEVEPRFGQRKEYKSAIESLTRSSLSDPARENLQALLDSLYGQAVAGISAGRQIGEADVRDLVDEGPYLAREALDLGLVDQLAYWDEFIGDAKARAGEDAEEVMMGRYLAGIERPNSTGTKVALIHGRGTIVSGSAEGGAFEEPGFGAHRIAKAISDAIDDDGIAAILFRIDSPGGSYIASDIVWREIRRAGEAGKPVVASMGGTAASGGYFVAMPADRIVANPGTLTGSIGVFGGKVVTTRLWEKLGITWDGLYAGDRAAMWSFVQDFPPGAEARFAALLDFIYDDFTAKAMEDRALDAEQIDAVARGRVWSGEDALAHGLVDALGGYRTALDEVRDLLDLEPDAPLELVLMPRPLSPFEQFVKALDGEVSATSLATALGPEDQGVVAQAARELGLAAGDLDLLRPPAGVLQMPALRLRY